VVRLYRFSSKSREMWLAIVFGFISLFLFIFGLMKLRMVWIHSRKKVEWGQLALTTALLVFSAAGFFRVFVELSVCTCGG
jgi:hypothetical protein